MLRPFGLGPAIFAAVLVVVLFILAGIAAGRLKGLIGVVAVSILTVGAFSAIAFWPTYEPDEPTHEQGPIDYVFLPRIALLVFLFIVLIKVLMQLIQHGLLGVARTSNVKNRKPISSTKSTQ